MIKNVIFDLGRVMYRYWPREDLINLGYSEARADRLMEIVFDNPLWIEFDRGTYTMSAGVEKICADYPDDAADIRHIFSDGWADRVEVLMPESVNFFREVREGGYKTYVLSNFPEDGFEYIRKRDAFFFDQMDGIVVSGYEKLIKPDPAIYHLILGRYNLIPQETVFIDDMEKNINAARDLGIHGILFKNIEDCKARFKTLTATD